MENQPEEKAPVTLEPVRPTVIEPRALPSQEMTDELVMAQYKEATDAGFPTTKMLGVMENFANQCVLTKQLPATVDTKEKLVMVFQAGRELGIPPMKALYSFYFVNNKMTMYGPTVIERIRRWAKLEYGTCDDTQATITITRKDDGTSLSSTVTMADLAAKGLAGKDTFKKHPRTMLLYKAVGQIVRHIVPEAIGGCAVEGDWGDDAHAEIEAPTHTVVGSINLDELRTKLRSVKTLDELKLAWANMPPAAKQALEEDKAEMKAILDTEASPTDIV